MEAFSTKNASREATNTPCPLHLCQVVPNLNYNHDKYRDGFMQDWQY